MVLNKFFTWICLDRSNNIYLSIRKKSIKMMVLIIKKCLKNTNLHRGWPLVVESWKRKWEELGPDPTVPRTALKIIFVYLMFLQISQLSYCRKWNFQKQIKQSQLRWLWWLYFMICFKLGQTHLHNHDISPLNAVISPSIWLCYCWTKSVHRLWLESVILSHLYVIHQLV